MEIAEQVKQIIVEHFDVDMSKLNPEARFIEDLGADSLAQIELALKFETQFDLNIPDNDAENIRTVGDAVTYIQKRKNS